MKVQENKNELTEKKQYIWLWRILKICEKSEHKTKILNARKIAIWLMKNYFVKKRTHIKDYGKKCKHICRERERELPNHTPCVWIGWRMKVRCEMFHSSTNVVFCITYRIVCYIYIICFHSTCSKCWNVHLHTQNIIIIILVFSLFCFHLDKWEIFRFFNAKKLSCQSLSLSVCLYYVRKTKNNVQKGNKSRQKTCTKNCLFCSSDIFWSRTATIIFVYTFVNIISVHAFEFTRE